MKSLVKLVAIFFLVQNIAIASDREVAQKRTASTTEVDAVHEGSDKRPKLEDAFQVPSLSTTLATNLACTLACTSSETPNLLVQRIANTWVRNASSYVFHADLRSFLELVVNACDATVFQAGHPEWQTGKFGMGFYSIFSLFNFAQTKGVVIELETTYWVDSGDLESYRIIFTKGQGSDVNVSTSQLEEAKYNSGTILRIKPAGENFSEETLQELVHYVHYLDFYPYVKTILHIGDQEKQIGGSTKECGQIFVSLNPNCLEVVDSGPGIPFDIAMQKLLIPSVSTKRTSDLLRLRDQARCEGPELLRLAQWRGKQKTSVSHFIVTVNGVVVIAKQLEKQIFFDTDVVDLVLAMPQATQLTLARNELAITPDGLSFEEETLKRIISHTITQALESGRDMTLLMALYHGLEAWEAGSAASHIKGLFTGFFRTEINSLIFERGIVAIPEQFVAFWLPIIEYLGMKDHAFIGLPGELVNFNYHTLEDCLVKAYARHIAGQVDEELLVQGINRAIISGKKLIVLPDVMLPRSAMDTPTVSDLGLQTTLFVPQCMIDTAKSKKATVDSQDYGMQADQAKTLSDHLAALIAPLYTKQAITAPRFAAARSGKVPFWFPAEPLAAVAIPQPVNQLPDESRDGFVKRALDCYAQCFNLVSKEMYEAIPHANPIKDLCERVFRLGKESTIPLQDVEFSFTNNIFTINGHEIDMSSYPIISFAMEAIVEDTFFPLIFAYCANPATSFNVILACLLALHGVNNFITPIKILSLQEKRITTLLGLYAFLQHTDTKSKSRRRQSLVRDFLQKTNPQLLATITEENCLNEEVNAQVVDAFVQNILHYRYNSGQIFMPSATGQYQQIWPLPFPLDAAAINQLSACLLSSGFSTISHQYDRTDWCFFKSDLPKKLSESPQLPATNGTTSDDSGKSEECYFDVGAVQFLPGAADRMVAIAVGAVSGEIPTDMMTSIADDVKKLRVHVDNFQVTLAGKITDLALDTFIAPLVALASSLEQRLSRDDQRQFTKMVEAILGLYDQYYAVNESDFQLVYGERQMFRAILSTQDISIRQLGDFLVEIFTHQPTLAAKLLSLTIDDHVFQTSFGQRSRDFDLKTMYQPSPFTNTPLSVAALLQETLGMSIVQKCLALVRNAQEFILTAYMLLHIPISSVIKQLQQDVHDQARLEGAIQYLITYFIREKLDQEKANMLYAELRPLKNTTERLLLMQKQPFMQDIAAYFQAIAGSQSSFSCQSESFEKLVLLGVDCECKLSQLLSAHCHGVGLVSLLEAANIVEVAKITKNHPEGAFRDKILQAVHAGGERTSIEATIIECIQNSIDVVKQMVTQASLPPYAGALACRSTSNDVTNIAVNLGFVPSYCSEESHFVVAIKDFVGMPSLKTLLTDLIVPDYSTKSPLTGSVGVMGNGTFQMYQQAEHVFVITRLLNDPKKVYCLAITPERNIDGMVHDLHLRCTDCSSLEEFNEFYGTMFYVVAKPEHHEQRNVLNFVAVKNFLRDAAGAVTTVTTTHEGRILPIQICTVPQIDFTPAMHVGGELLNPQPTEADMLFVSSDQRIKIFNRPHGLLPSYISTGGVPFLPLMTVIKELYLLPPALLDFVSSGIVLDLAPGLYQPVQSRTHLKVTPTVIQELRKGLLDAVFLKFLQQGSQDVTLFNRYITHFESRYSDLRQLSLDSSVNQEVAAAIDIFIETGHSNAILIAENFFTYYKPQAIPGSVSIFQEVQKACVKLVPQFELLEYNTLQEFTRLIEQAKSKVAAEEQKEDVRTWIFQQRDLLRNQASEKSQQFLTEWKRQVLAASEKPELLVPHIVIPWVGKKLSQWPTDFLVRPLSDREILRLIPELCNEKEVKENKAGLELYNELEPHKKVLQSILTKLLQEYCNAFQQCSPTHLFLAGGTCWVQENSGALASYNESTQKIQVNLCGVKISEMIKIAQNIVQRELSCLTRNQHFSNLFGVCSGNIGSVVHELEHARRGSSTNIHGPGQDATGQWVHFEACAASYAQQAFEVGLIEHWAEKLRFDFDEQQAFWLLDKIIKLEKKNHLLLLDLFN